jgi:hypothetical protein
MLNARSPTMMSHSARKKPTQRVAFASVGESAYRTISKFLRRSDEVFPAESVARAVRR